MSIIAHLLTNGAMAQLRELRLFGNKIGDQGLEALSGALATGAMANCRYLLLQHNKIGDAGMEAFASACASGAMASLEELRVDNPDHPALNAACEARSIEL